MLTPRCPNLRQVKLAGDFEGVVSFGLGLRRKTGFRVFRLTAPTRIVVDVRHVPPPARAAAARACTSSDLRYPFMPGGPDDFGVFKLRIRDGGCATAHRVAKAWMRRFEANLEDGRVQLPRHVRGFHFTQLPPDAAQTYRLRGSDASRTIRFSYVVPNG